MTPGYVLDANILIEAKRRYYGFDFCPGFWECLLHHCDDGKICSIDQIKDEMIGEGDDLSDWIKNQATGMFVQTDEEVANAFADLMKWVQAQEHLMEAAKDEFARVADGWIVAYAMVNGHTVVTHEAYNKDVRKKVQIPNLCREFGVAEINTFDMLRALQARFLWSQ